MDGSEGNRFYLDCTICFPKVTVYIPPEILEDILLSLEPSTLGKLAFVNKYWRSIVTPLFAVRQMRNLNFSILREANAGSQPFTASEPKLFKNYRFQIIPPEEITYYKEMQLVHKNDPSEKYNISMVHSNYSNSHQRVSSRSITKDILKYVEIKPCNKKFVVTSTYSTTQEYLVETFLFYHLGRIWKDIATNQMDPKAEEELIRELRKHENKNYADISPQIEKFQEDGFVFDMPENDEIKIAKKLSLHNYQIEACRWMKNIEKHGLDMHPSMNCELTKNAILKHLVGTNTFNAMNFFIDLKQKKFVLNRYNEIKKVYGACLCDDVGLGKTRTIVSLIAESPRKAIHTSQTKLPLKANTTLIICKNGLCEMWKEELMKADLSVMTYSQVPKQKNIHTILKYDVVVIAREVLKNKYLDDKKKYLAEGKKLADIPYFEDEIYPLFHAIEWHRVCVDEAHELDTFPEREEIFSLKARNRYYISATPFSNVKQILNCQRFFNLSDFVQSAGTTNYDVENSLSSLWFHLLLEMFKKMIWRNIKKNAEGKDTYELDAVNLKPILLKFHPCESALFNVLKAGYKLGNSNNFVNNPYGEAQTSNNLCRHYFIIPHASTVFGDSPLPLNEFLHCLIAITNATMTATKQELDYKISLSKMRCRWPVKFDKEGMQRKIKVMKKQLKVLTNYKKLHKIEDSEIEKNFTTECNERIAAIAASNAAGSKETRTMNKIVQDLATNDKFISNFTFDDYDSKEDIKLKLGTKLGEVFYLIREILEDDDEARIILFSSELIFTKLIHEVLELNSISNTILANAKESVLKKFKSLEIRVLLCCSKGSASGLNLQDASNIIIADTYNYRDAKKSESEVIQIVGRSWRQGQTKKVNVYRLMMKGTKEEKDVEDEMIEGDDVDDLKPGKTKKTKEKKTKEMKAKEKEKAKATPPINNTLITTTFKSADNNNNNNNNNNGKAKVESIINTKIENNNNNNNDIKRDITYPLLIDMTEDEPLPISKTTTTTNNNNNISFPTYMKYEMPSPQAVAQSLKKIEVNTENYSSKTTTHNNNKNKNVKGHKAMPKTTPLSKKKTQTTTTKKVSSKRNEVVYSDEEDFIVDDYDELSIEEEDSQEFSMPDLFMDDSPKKSTTKNNNNTRGKRSCVVSASKKNNKTKKEKIVFEESEENEENEFFQSEESFSEEESEENEENEFFQSEESFSEEESEEYQSPKKNNNNKKKKNNNNNNEDKKKVSTRGRPKKQAKVEEEEDEDEEERDFENDEEDTLSFCDENRILFPKKEDAGRVTRSSRGINKRKYSIEDVSPFETTSKRKRLTK